MKNALRGFEAYVPGEQPPDEMGRVKLNSRAQLERRLSALKEMLN